MSRNIKCRRVCAEPNSRRFSPDNNNENCVIMTVEELEAIRLCDLECLDQDTASERMNISRGTFQRILYSARKNVAEALVAGKSLLIEGGTYETIHQYCKREVRCLYCRFYEEENNK